MNNSTVIAEPIDNIMKYDKIHKAVKKIVQIMHQKRKTSGR